MSTRWSRYPVVGGLLTALVLLVVVYRPTVQTIPNGSSQLLMIDVGETQVVLNTWGTLHATGYPLYVISGNALVTLMKAIGVSAATAPALVSLLWGLLALGILYGVILHIGGQQFWAFVMVVIFGLTRFAWLHNVIAEVYSCALLFVALLYMIALWQRPVRYRMGLLGFVGGLGVAHYRGIGLLAPALIYAAWPYIGPEVRRRPWKMGLWLGAGLLGFLPYIYLPLRAQARARWVYGELDTWQGFWDQFTAREFRYLLGWPESYTAFVDNFDRINDLLRRELSIPAVVLGLTGLVVGVMRPHYRRLSISLGLAAGSAYLFSTVFYFEVLAILILTITLSLVVGLLLLFKTLLQWLVTHLERNLQTITLMGYGVISLLAIGYGAWLYHQNAEWIKGLTHDQTGLFTIDIAANTPPGSTLMLAWGPRYYAVGFAQDVQHRLQEFRRVDHKGDFARIIAENRLITPEFTLFNQPVSWWEQRLNSRVYLQAVAPYLVQIDTQAEYFPADRPLPEAPTDIPIVALQYSVRCVGKFKALYVDWLALEVPLRHLSVMVHLLNASGEQLDEADQYAPVYGWRPVTTWEKREIVRDVYPLPDIPGAAQVRFGLYEQLAGGEFQNYRVKVTPLECSAASEGD
jgi:hypothetical protein